MKNLIIIILAVIGISLLTSCAKEEKDPKLDMNLTVKQAFTDPADGAAFVLTKERADSVMTEFQWSAAVYSLSELENTKYELQMAMADSNFAKIITLVSTTATSFTITEGEMNEKLLSWNLETDVPYNLEFRLLAYVNSSTTFTNVYSGVITLSITLYADVVTAPALYVPGDYQGWSPAEAPKIYDFDNDGVYNGYIYFPEGGTLEFKFTSDPDWDHTNYGDGGPGVLNTDSGAGNLKVPSAGGYAFVVDINNLTWSYTLQNWGVIGEWLGWASDINLEWDLENQQLFTTVENIPAAENQRFKFRANDEWTINLGAKDPDDGTLVQDGRDIPIPAGGTITFYLRFTTPLPTYQIVVK